MTEPRDEKIENIWIAKTTQVGIPKLKTGALLLRGEIFKLDQPYKSAHNLPSGKPAPFKIDTKMAAKLIQSNKAISVIRDGNAANGKWVAVDVYGDRLKQDIKIILRKDIVAAEKAAADKAAAEKAAADKVAADKAAANNPPPA